VNRSPELTRLLGRRTPVLRATCEGLSPLLLRSSLTEAEDRTFSVILIFSPLLSRRFGALPRELALGNVRGIVTFLLHLESASVCDVAVNLLFPVELAGPASFFIGSN